MEGFTRLMPAWHRHEPIWSTWRLSQYTSTYQAAYIRTKFNQYTKCIMRKGPPKSNNDISYTSTEYEWNLTAGNMTE